VSRLIECQECYWAERSEVYYEGGVFPCYRCTAIPSREKFPEFNFSLNVEQVYPVCVKPCAFFLSNDGKTAGEILSEGSSEE